MTTVDRARPAPSAPPSLASVAMSLLGGPGPPLRHSDRIFIERRRALGGGGPGGETARIACPPSPPLLVRNKCRQGRVSLQCVGFEATRVRRSTAMITTIARPRQDGVPNCSSGGRRLLASLAALHYDDEEGDEEAYKDVDNVVVVLVAVRVVPHVRPPSYRDDRDVPPPSFGGGNDDDDGGGERHRATTTTTVLVMLLVIPSTLRRGGGGGLARDARGRQYTILGDQARPRLN